MENKKKYHGFLKLLLVPLFIMLLNIFSICYATSSFNYSNDELQIFMDNINNIPIRTGLNSNESVINSNIHLLLENKTLSYWDNLFNNIIINYLNTNSNLSNISINKGNLIFFIYTDSSYSAYLNILISNNSYGNNFGFLYANSYLWSSQSGKYVVSARTYADNIYRITIKIDSTDTIGSPSIEIINGSNQSQLGFYSQNTTIGENDSVIIPGFFYFKQGLPGIYYANATYPTQSNFLPYILETPLEFPVPEPEPESNAIGTITNSSGDITGNIELSGIEQGLGNIQNQISGDTNKVIENQNENTQTIVNSISGEVGKVTNALTSSADNLIDNTTISSGDIAGTVDFSIIENDENYSAYTNFWYNLTTGFSNSMTNVVRTLPVEFRGDTYIINLDDFTVFIPAVLKTFLGIISSVFVCLYITRESKHIVEDIQTASIDNVANKLTEDFETNMF